MDSWFGWRRASYQGAMTSDEARATVPEGLDGSRLDKAAVELFPGVSRAKIKRAIDAREVRVNGKIRAKGSMVAQGDVLTLSVAPPSADAPAVPTKDVPLIVRHETSTVLVVEKVAGMPTAPLRPNETGTLANILVGHRPELAGIGYGPREPGLLHRIDTDTSGLVLVAKTKAAFDLLSAALKNLELEKSYLLICKSADLPDSGTIEFPIANHPKDQRRVYPCIHPRDVMRYEPRPALTQYEVRARRGDYALVEAVASRALRHQIRAHFAAIDHPLVGDTLYGGEADTGLIRHALHAHRIAFSGRESVEAFDVRSELPEDMQRFFDSKG